MTKADNLMNKQFGKFAVIDRAINSKAGKSRWVCKCECGNVRIVVGSDLKSGKTKSCGCIQKIHGHSSHRTFKIFAMMKERCYNPKSIVYKYYGGKGIKICKEWLEDFDAFYVWSLENGYSSDKTIDRIDSNRGYEPDNCRWVDKFVQAQNQKLRADNTSGVRGVKYNKARRKWEVSIQAKGKRHYLGLFEDLDRAKQVRKEAEKTYWDI